MNIATRRPLWPRLKAQARAAYLNWLIGVYEKDVELLRKEAALGPRRIEKHEGHIATLRVDLALAERDA